MNKKILVFVIIGFFIAASVLPKIITDANAKHENKSLINQNNINREIQLGTVNVYSSGNQNDIICDALKTYRYNSIDVSADGEHIDFLVDVNILVRGWFDLGTAIVSIADNAKTQSYDDYIDTTWRFSLWCTRGRVIPYTITAVLSDVNFDPVEQSDTEMGALTCPKSFSLFNILFELNSKIGNVIINKIENQKILIQGSIQCI